MILSNYNIKKPLAALAFALFVFATLINSANAQSISISANSNPICAGASVTFVATVSGVVFPSFAWYVNGAYAGQDWPNDDGVTSFSNLQNGSTVICYMFYGGFNYASNTITMSVANPANYYLDADGDGFGSGSPVQSCSPPSSSYVTNNLDCNDANFNIKPTAVEIRCNGIDENCNGMADDTGPEINVQGFSINIPDGSTSTSLTNNTDFGSSYINTPVVKSFAISNQGTSALNITGISNTNPTVFNSGISNITFPVVLGVGSSLTFSVQYTPTSLGVSTATLIILNNDCDEGTYNFVIQGTGVCTPFTPTVNGSTTGCGEVSLTATGGSTYFWSGGNSVNSATNTFTNSGTYTVTVIDANGCSGSASVNITVNPLPSPSISGTLSFCNGSSTTLDAGSYSGYSWSTGETTQAISVSSASTFTVNVTNANGCTGSASATTVVNANPTPSISGTLSFCNGSSTTLDAGSYAGYSWSTGETTQTISVSSASTFTVTVTNVNGCTGSASATTVVNANPTPSISGTLSFCNGSSTTLDAGLFASYNWSTGATTQTISVSTASTFTVTVTNASGCTGSSSATTNVNANLTPSISGVTSICAGSSTTLDAGSYAGYNWSTGETTQTISVSNASTFTVTVTNANGCTGSASATTIVNANPTPSISGTLSFCNGSSTTLDAGAFASYNWSTGATTQTIAVSTASIFTVTVTNSNGCTGSASATTTVNTNLTPSITGATSLCSGGSTTLDAGLFASYNWSTGATTQTITVNVAGVYSVIVTNSSGCTGSASVSVSQSLPLAVSNSVTNVQCKGNSTGSVVLTVSNGKAPYSYLWSDGTTTKDHNNLYAGPITVTVSDMCTSKTYTIKITEPATGMLFVVSKTSPKCNGGNNGSASISISGGTAPFAYLWSNGKTTATILSITAGVYTCIVTDASSCTRSVIAIITEPSALLANTTKVNPTGGFNNGSASAAPSGGTSPYTYLWNTSPAKTTATITGLGAGVYTVKVTDKSGCFVNSTVTLVASRLIASSQQEISMAVIPNPNDGNFVLSINACCDTKAKVQLFDNTLRLVLTQSLLISQGENKKAINLSNYTKGMYFLKYDDGNEIKTIKVIIK